MHYRPNLVETVSGKIDQNWSYYIPAKHCNISFLEQTTSLMGWSARRMMRGDEAVPAPIHPQPAAQIPGPPPPRGPAIPVPGPAIPVPGPPPPVPVPTPAIPPPAPGPGPFPPRPLPPPPNHFAPRPYPGLGHTPPPPNRWGQAGWPWGGLGRGGRGRVSLINATQWYIMSPMVSLLCRSRNAVYIGC